MENKQCKNCHKTFSVSQSDLVFYEKVSPVIGGQKLLIPSPSFCPDCRMQRRLSFRNERNLYQRKCDLCKSNIISVYSPDNASTVYCDKCWYSDKWDAKDYGQDFDFKKNFFSQFHDLLKKIPINSPNQASTLENSDYVTYTADAKNCYLCYASNWIENCMYSSYIWETKDSIDCSHSTKLELCYECMDCDRLYHCQFLQQSRDCNDCILGYGLKNCTNCFGCINLVNKEYYYLNKPLSKEKYLEKLKEILSEENKFNYAQQEYYKLSLKHPRKFAHHINCEDVSGDGLKDCKNSHYCFDGYGGENLKWMINFPGKTKDCYDISGCAHLELGYECHAVYPGYHILFSLLNLNNGKEVMYSAFCDGGSNLFGCVGIKKAEYAILNKEYSKTEYEKLVIKIIAHMKETGEWGEYFSTTVSPFAYNETVASEYFPLRKDEVLVKKWKWKNFEEKKASVDNLICKTCKKNFKIIPQEQKYYQENNIIIPEKCPDCRHLSRIQSRNSRSLWKRQCMCTQPSHTHAGRCLNEFETTYSPERKELVYCEDCYKKEIY